MIAESPEPPSHIFKFSRPKQGKVTVELAVDLDKEWAKQQNEHLSQEIGKVAGLLRELQREDA